MKRGKRGFHDDLHCNGKRSTGGEPNRLEIAATDATDADLEVWFARLA